MYIGVSYSAQPALRHTDQMRQYFDGVKRIIDVVIVLGLSPIWGPLVALLCGLVRLHGDTGFFAHTRLGRDGVPFQCWKIRTMVRDADRQLDLYLQTDATAAKEWCMYRKLSHDRRGSQGWVSCCADYHWMSCHNCGMCCVETWHWSAHALFCVAN